MLKHIILAGCTFLLFFAPITFADGKNRNNDSNEKRIIYSHLTVDDLRDNILAVESERISVLGVLMPLREEGRIVNALLVPNKEFLSFEPWIASSFSIRLGNIVDTDGDLRINEACYGEFVMVSGVAKIFSGMPSIDVFLLNKAVRDASVKCLTEHRTGEPKTD